MVDVAYCWRDWKEALRAIEMFADEDIYFVETPLPSDDIEGYAKLVPGLAGADRGWRMAEHALRIPASSCDRDALDVVQPDVGRVGGLTEARRVAHACARPRPRRRAALLEIGDRHRRLGASGGRLADLHLHRVPAERAGRFAPAARLVREELPVVDGRDSVAGQARPRHHDRRRGAGSIHRGVTGAFREPTCRGYNRQFSGALPAGNNIVVRHDRS